MTKPPEASILDPVHSQVHQFVIYLLVLALFLHSVYNLRNYVSLSRFFSRGAKENADHLTEDCSASNELPKKRISKNQLKKNGHS